MKQLFPTFAQGLRSSVLVRTAVVMGFLALLSLASIVVSTVIAEDISGRANAVNVSGSLRMLSFRTLSEVLQPEARPQAIETIDIFESRLNGLERFIVAKSSAESPSVVAVHEILSHWHGHIRSLEVNAAHGNPAALDKLPGEIRDFVEQIDRFVYLTETELENKVRLLRAIQLGLLACIVVVSLFVIWMLRRQLVQPLVQLVQAAGKVTRGSFDVQVSHISDDELGQLGRAFNAMVTEIASMYDNLEMKVLEKTRELSRTNQSLELLYWVSQELSASDLTLDKIQSVLSQVEKDLGLGHSMICLSENCQMPAQMVTGNLTADELQKLCDCSGQTQCFVRALNSPGQESTTPVVIIPIGDGDRFKGVLPILLKGTEPLPRKKLRIIETVGHHVSNALINMRRSEEKHRMAVLEERGVIARELHDSIAQSLSYLRIQVTRLEKCLDQDNDPRSIAMELKQGLGGAYRELRELIQTFRLRIDARGFNIALQETIAEFSDKLGFSVRLNNALSGIVLSGNEEMHLIRIIREALSNIERHAQASAASVDIAIDAHHAVTVRIADNGRGFDPGNLSAHQFGVNIMHDRAQILEGCLTVEAAPNSGTVVSLHFLPQKVRQPNSGPL